MHHRSLTQRRNQVGPRRLVDAVVFSSDRFSLAARRTPIGSPRMRSCAAAWEGLMPERAGEFTQATAE